MRTLILFVYCLNLFFFFIFYHTIIFNHNHGFIDLQYIFQSMQIQILSETKKKL